MEFVSGRRIGNVIDLRDRRHRHGEHPIAPHSPVGAVGRPPVRVGPDWTLQAVADAMGEAKVSAVVVGPDRAIATERDLARALDAGLGPEDQVEAICVTDLIYVDDDVTVVQAAIEMLRYDIRDLLLRNWRGEITGIVTLRDVLSVLVDAMDPAVWVLVQQTLSLQSHIRSR
jgi:signal-transduction protein with cAMP-binding, CBS, and nucleotidyltransferase domain